MTKLFRIGLLGILAGVAAFGQTTTTQTTLSSAMTTGAGSPPTQMCVASSTNISAPSFGTPAATAVVVDKEYMTILAATPSSTCWIVQRGANGTQPTSHSSGAVVWVGPQGGGGSALGVIGLSPFRNIPAVVGTPCTAASQPYLPQIVTGSEGYQNQIGWVFNCPTTGPSANVWQAVELPLQPYKTFYAALDAGASNAITASIPGLPQVKGTCVAVVLANTLQAGADTFALNGGTAKNIKSHYNAANNIGTAYANTGVWKGCYDGTEYLDESE